MLASEDDVVVEYEDEQENKEMESLERGALGRTSLEEDSEQPQDALELMGDDFDEPDDVPAVDMQ